MTTDVSVKLFAGQPREETVVLSQNVANIIIALSELYSAGLISADQDITGHTSYEDEVVVECPSAITFKGRCVAAALMEEHNA